MTGAHSMQDNSNEESSNGSFLHYCCPASNKHLQKMHYTSPFYGHIIKDFTVSKGDAVYRSPDKDA